MSRGAGTMAAGGSGMEGSGMEGLGVESLAGRFGSGREGSVAITFALALVPTMLVMGAGIDYGRATMERATLQSGVDAAALAGIGAIRKGETVSDSFPLVYEAVVVNDVNPAVQVTGETLSPDGTTLCVTATSSVPTTLMGLAGIQSVSLGAQACATLNLDTYEIAFAFDNSESMANSAQSGGLTKMQAAQKAANGLITALAPQANGNPGVQASYSVTPFSSSVNVGANNQGAAWLDNAGQSSIHWKSFTAPAGYKKPASLFAMLKTMGVPWGGCVEERPAPYTTTDTPANAAISPDTLYAPYFWPDETDANPYGPNYNAATFNNYVGDQSGSCKAGDAFAVADQQAPGRGDGQTKLCKYTGTIASTQNQYYVTQQAAGPNAGCAVPAMTTLNATSSTANAAINAMKPIGDTVLVTGFMWAWRSISQNGPFATTGAANATAGPARPRAYGYVDPATTAVNHKVIILLTDGEDDWFGQANDGYTAYTQYDPNQLVYNGFGYPQEGRLGLTNGTNARQLLDNAMLSACANAKATKDAQGNPAPVEVYTVGFLATDGIDAQGQSLLQSCATDQSHVFIATNGDAVVAAFQQIAANISAPRIAR